MTAFIRRFREIPTLDILSQIEQIAIVDGTPKSPVVGVGSGTLMLIGEFEDGPFNVPSEIFGETDEFLRFGGFGYSYGNQIHMNASARISLGEVWNGNGFLKGKFLRPRRKIVVRVDTSVGDVAFAPHAGVWTDDGTFRLAAGDFVAVEVDGGAAVPTPTLAADAALYSGTAFPATTSGFVGGEQLALKVDAGAEVIVTFSALDQTAAQIADRINQALGYNAATEPAVDQVDIVGIVEGTDGALAMNGTATGGGASTLTAIGLIPSTTDGTGNVGNISAVSANEISALFGTVPNVGAVVYGARAVIASGTPGASGSIQFGSSTMQEKLGLPTTLVVADEGPATKIPAGTRVRNGSGDWVLMQSIDVAEGTAAEPNEGAYPGAVRGALDNGSSVAQAPGTGLIVIDQPEGRVFGASFPAGVSAALTEDQLDVAYERAFDATLDVVKISREANYTLSARRSPAVVSKGRSNAERASDEGNQGRSFHTRAPFGILPNEAIDDVALYRSDRVFYTYPSWEARIPEIAAVGSAGGVGFADGGTITLGADGPLAYINSVLPPEENPGQDTGLLDFVFGIEPIQTELTINTYIAFKRAGICAPRVDRRGIPVYQSEMTADLTRGLTTQKRRKMADYIQDTLASLLLPYSKKLATDAREASIDAVFDSFLSSLKSVDAPELQRIRDYSVRDTTSQFPELRARGITARKVQVQMLNSLDTFLIETEIGEGVVVVRE